MAAAHPIRLLIVEANAPMRAALARIAGQDPEIEVVGTTSDPRGAEEAIRRLEPDVLVLDADLPGMNGASFVEGLMARHPMPVVMVSTRTASSALNSVRALESGAMDVVGKPTRAVGLDSIAVALADKVKAAAGANVAARHHGRETHPERFHGLPPVTGCSHTGTVIGIGASTGGVEALRALLTALPPDMPPILVVQHMPGLFTGSFAARLDSLCQLHVKEAVDGEPVVAGTVYVGPGGRQFELDHLGPRLVCRLGSTERVSGHAPSVDVLFRSMTRVCPLNSLGVLLTGMGRDGADGLLELREAGAHTIGQDEASSVVYGMPRAAYEIGAVERQLPLTSIAPYLKALFGLDEHAYHA